MQPETLAPERVRHSSTIPTVKNYITGKRVAHARPKTFSRTNRQPIGVVGLLPPWSFPVGIPMWKIAPALLAGNTVVFKPSTYTPITAVKIVEIFEEAGFPPGTLNMVLGGGGT